MSRYRKGMPAKCRMPFRTFQEVLMASKNSCGKCTLVFGSIGAFDKHRIGSHGEGIYAPDDVKRKNPIAYTKPTRRCMTLDEIMASGMVQNKRGWWIIGGFDGEVFEKDAQSSLVSP